MDPAFGSAPLSADAPARRDRSSTYARIVGEVARSGLSQDQIAAATGSTVRSVQNWASGASTPRLPNAQRLLDVQAIVQLLRDAYTDEGIEIWFNSRNRNLDLRRPIDLLTVGMFNEVLDEARWVVGGRVGISALADSIKQARP